MVKFIETKREWRLPGAGGGRTGGYCLMGMGFQFEVIKNVLETDDDDSCTAVWMYFNITELCSCLLKYS